MKKNIPIIVFALILLAGLLTFNRYGESWDDRSLQKYAALSLNAYIIWPNEGIVEITPQDLGYYGPFFVMVVSAGSQALEKMLPISLPDLRHLIYFITFYGGLIGLYTIGRRWFKPIPALGIVLLFSTQPVFWGHAFFNPKDMPFLAFFTLSLAAGFKMMDSFQGISPAPVENPKKGTVPVLTILWLVSVFSLFIFTESIHKYISDLVYAAWNGDTNIVIYIASKIHQVPPEDYIRRYFLLFMQARSIYFWLSTGILLYIWHRLQPALLKLLLASIFPAILLGLTTSIRILGPFAGIIIGILALRTLGKRALPGITIYAVLALITTYLTWPFLWENPAIRLWGSLTEMASYPWFGEVLFNGTKYISTDLPYSYLPVLLAIQLTEPVWVLSLAGVLVSAVDGRRTGKYGLMELSLLWFFIPFAAFIGLRVSLYDNFRQILFILPPVFLMAGFAIDRIRNSSWQAALIAICLIPGLIGIFKLHPYEYIYYNSFVGGVGKVQGRFETDYWLVSYREAAEYINDIAPPEAAVWVDGPGHLYTIFSRSDLKVYSWSKDQFTEPIDYSVTTTRFDMDKTSYPEAEIIHKIIRDNVVLTVIKKP